MEMFKYVFDLFFSMFGKKGVSWEALRVIILALILAIVVILIMLGVKKSVLS